MCKYIDIRDIIMQVRSGYIGRFFFVLVLSGLLLSLYPGCVSAGDSGIPYSPETGEGGDCFIQDLPVTIDVPGTYILNHSQVMNETPVLIRSSDVILEGLGTNLTGNGTIGFPGILVKSELPLTNITIKNLTLEQYDAGIQAESVEGGHLQQVTLASNLRTGFSGNSCSSFKIEKCEIKNTYNNISGGYGVVLANCSNISLKSVTLTGNGKSGKSNSGGGLLTGTRYCNITGSVVSGNSGTGLVAEAGSDNLSISSSVLSGNQGNGISVTDCAGFTLRDTQFSVNKGTGIDLTRVSCPELTGNQVSGSSIGISLSDVSDMMMAKNILKNNRIGFDISASDIRYLYHRIDQSNTIDSKILLYLCSKENFFIDSPVNPATIIAVNCSDFTISNVVLSKNGAGITLAGCRHGSIKNTVQLDNGIGIFSLFGTNDIKFSRTYAERNLISGYYFADTKNLTFTSVYAQDSPFGMYLKNSSDIQMDSISISGIEGVKSRKPSGIILNQCMNVTLSDSLITDCQYSGLLSDTQMLHINGTIFSKNGNSGCILLSGSADIRNCTLKENDESGMLVYVNNSRFISNSLVNNTRRGLGLVSAGSNLFSGNLFRNNKNCELAGVKTGNVWNIKAGEYPELNTTGNYWGTPDNTGFSDLCPVEKTGFCKDPYVIGENNTDYSPLASDRTGISSFQVNETDMNRNGKEDLQDVVQYMKMVSAGEHENLYDFSGDGRINLQDVIVLFHIIRKK